MNADGERRRAVVVVSANAEWEIVRDSLPERYVGGREMRTPYGQAFDGRVSFDRGLAPIVFLHGGWGKIDAAASAQYAIDRWRPDVLMNLGTCGGFAGEIDRGTIVMATKTLVYDIVEQMSDPEAAFAHYTTTMDLSWLKGPPPIPVQRGLLLSGDRDLVAEEISELRQRFGGTAGDWESGAIAHVASRNRTRCLILRGVTDLVGPDGGEAYDGTLAFFRESARRVMTRLLDSLPGWLDIVLS
ncbi:MAG: hypothetical protein ACP5HG_02385 [Anaerolineae bacterium]